MNILFVDDSKVYHTFINEIFEDTHNIIHANSGEEALDILLKEKKEVDLVLLDWEMPGLTGPEVFEKMKEAQLDISVIMVTSRNEIHDLNEMLEAGVDDYVMKPFTKEILVEKLYFLGFC